MVFPILPSHRSIKTLNSPYPHPHTATQIPSPTLQAIHTHARSSYHPTLSPLTAGHKKTLPRYDFPTYPLKQIPNARKNSCEMSHLDELKLENGSFFIYHVYAASTLATGVLKIIAPSYPFFFWLATQSIYTNLQVLGTFTMPTLFIFLIEQIIGL